MFRTVYPVLVALIFPCLSGNAEELFVLDTSDDPGVVNTLKSLFVVNQQTGATTLAIEELGRGSWMGLTAAQTEGRVLYAVQNPRPLTFDDPKFSRLARIDVDAAEVTLFPFFDWDVLGFGDGHATGVAISPSDPTIAIVVGGDLGIPPTSFVWEVNAETGEVLGPARELINIRRIESVTFNLDGTTLYGTNQDGHLVTVDLETATATVVGDPGLSLSITGLAFHPDTGDLFAVDGRLADRLVRLNPNDGSTMAVIGPLGIKGPEGLAFLPTTDVFDPLDCSQDGMVDADDLDCANAAGITDSLLTELGLFPGDLDGMNGVNFADFLTFSGFFDKPTSKYTEGDITGDGWVGFEDFVLLASNFGRPPLS